MPGLQGGVKASIKSRLAGSNGLCSDSSGANTVASTSKASTPEAICTSRDLAKARLTGESLAFQPVGSGATGCVGFTESVIAAPCYFFRRRGSTSTYKKSTNRLITTYSSAMNIR